MWYDPFWQVDADKDGEISYAEFEEEVARLVELCGRRSVRPRCVDAVSVMRTRGSFRKKIGWIDFRVQGQHHFADLCMPWEMCVRHTA